MDKYQRIGKRKIFVASWLWCFFLFKIHVPRIIKYIANQEEHHKSKTFGDEYFEILKESGIDYDERYILKTVT